MKLKLGQLKQQLVSGSSSLTSLAVCSRVCVLLSAILHLHCIFVDRGRARAVVVVLVVVVLVDMWSCRHVVAVPNYERAVYI